MVDGTGVKNVSDRLTDDNVSETSQVGWVTFPRLKPYARRIRWLPWCSAAGGWPPVVSATCVLFNLCLGIPR